MAEIAVPAAPRRLVSLDVFRGLTIAGMLLVNNPGSWRHVHAPFRHAAWNGWTFTDLIFPFFLFIAGVAMMFSFPKRLARGETRRTLLGHVLRRAAGLMVLGYWGGTFSPLVFPGTLTAAGAAFRGGFVLVAGAGFLLVIGARRPRLWLALLVVGLAVALGAGAAAGAAGTHRRRLAELRVPGVLVRIAWCYLLAAALYFLTPRPRALAAWIVLILAAYWVWMLYVPVPGFGTPDLTRGFPSLQTPRAALFSNWCFYIDHHVLGRHVWGARKLVDPATGKLLWSFDPEGILSTAPAICTVLLGILAGLWLNRPDRTPPEKARGLLVAGAGLLVVGLAMSAEFPINKRLWTSSYVVFMAGMALLVLAACYHVVDVRGHRRWCGPFVWYGMNAITAFVLSGMFTQAIARLGWKSWVMEHLFFPACQAPANASLAFALGFVLVWAGVAGLLYWRRIFLRL